MNLNDRIGQCLGLNSARTQAIGIELEYEGWNGEQPTTKHWKLTADTSLRNNGIEFVSGILTPDKLDSALLEVEGMIKATNVKPHERCGVHIHLNEQPYTWGNLWSFSVLYTLLEPTIFKLWAPERTTSHFCVPSYCNNDLSVALMNDITMLRLGVPAPEERREEAPRRRGQVRFNNPAIRADRVVEGVQLDRAREVLARARRENDWLRAHEPGGLEPVDLEPPPRRADRGGLHIFGTSKYNAMNYGRLGDLGTVEMRQLGSTDDIDRIRQWIKFLCNLQSKANDYKDPLQVLEKYENVGLEAMCEDVGLQPQEVNEDDQDDALDNATFMAGYVPPKWEDLDWTMREVA